MDCKTCELIKKSRKVFEDDDVVAIMSPAPSVMGHVLVMPKEHHTIIEQVPDFVVSRLFHVVNKIASSVFEATSATGTNILIQNGLAAGQENNHFMIHVLARREGDGLDMSWAPRQLDEEKMSTVELQLKDETMGIGEFEKKESAPMQMEKTETIEHDEEDYRLRQLDRTP